METGAAFSTDPGKQYTRSAHLFNSSFNTIIMLDYYLIEFYSRKVHEADSGD